MHKHIIYIIFSVFILCSCEEEEQEKSQDETTYSGHMKIAADESFSNIVSAQKFMFENIYEDATLDIEYTSQNGAIQHFANKEANLIVIGKNLSTEQLEHLKEQRQMVQTRTVAYDGIALVVNRNFNKSSISMEQLSAVLNGKYRSWHQLSDSLNPEPVQIVADRSSSSNLIYLNEKTGLKRDSISIYAAGTNKKVLDYIRTNSNAMGIVGAGFLSDAEDPEVKRYLNDLKVLRVSASGDSAYSPAQKYLYDFKYPLTRPVVVVFYGKTSSLATGFTSFMLSDKGQKIILKDGLLPAQLPERSIQIVNQNIQ